MEFFWFAITNFIMGFVFIFAFSLVIMAITFPLSLLAQKVSVFVFVILPVAVIAQCFLILWWAAYLAEKTILITSKDSVVYDWLYVVAAFLSATAPLRYMAGKETQLDERAGEAPRERENKQIGQFAYITVAAIGFLVFYFYPPAMHFIYGWFLQWWFGV